jgi:hypothetical protein
MEGHCMTDDNPTSLPTEHVEYVKELYPRLRPDDDAIERYRHSIDALPPIVVARGRVLVDGYHRWQAHKREGLETVPAVDLGNLTDAEIFNESIRRNATHGQQLSAADKKRLARKLWTTLAHLSGTERQAEIMALLAVSERSVQQWTAEARKSEKDEQKSKAWDLWLDCLTQDEIAEQVGVPRPTIASWIVENRKSADFNNAPESRQHFDVWQFATADKTDGNQSYFGAIPPQVVENLLWLYTDPGSTVIDLFAGSGTTIDVAKRMGRRVWASDIRGNWYAPNLPIHEHDVTTGWPANAPKRADLVLLDPPYWKQAQGRYSDRTNELAEMGLDDFNDAWANILGSCADRADRIAYIISPTQTEDGQVIDHATEMLKAAWDVGLHVERRIVVCYSTQQATGQQVTWARENKRLLKLYRDLVVLSKGPES